MMRPAVLAVMIAGASIASASCAAVGSTYERPELTPPTNFRFTTAPDQAQSLADAPWFEVFDDPTLQALIKEAIVANLDLRVAVARVEEARARAGIARSFLYPEVNAVAGYTTRAATSTEDERRKTPDQPGLRAVAMCASVL